VLQEVRFVDRQVQRVEYNWVWKVEWAEHKVRKEAWRCLGH
jgi:hypothetical protein